MLGPGAPHAPPAPPPEPPERPPPATSPPPVLLVVLVPPPPPPEETIFPAKESVPGLPRVAGVVNPAPPAPITIELGPGFKKTFAPPGKEVLKPPAPPPPPP